MEHINSLVDCSQSIVNEVKMVQTNIGLIISTLQKMQTKTKKTDEEISQLKKQLIYTQIALGTCVVLQLFRNIY